MLDKLNKNLGLSKNDVLQDMSRFAEQERKKSILGKINNDQGQNKQNIGFFSLDDSEFKLKQADWLGLVCFTPMISECLKRQSHYLNSV